MSNEFLPYAADVPTGFRWNFYCNDCGKKYPTNNEFRCLCPECAKEMGLPAETAENPYPGFFG